MATRLCLTGSFRWFFVATTASIVSGALAERVRLWSFFAFIFILVSLIYPVVGAMTWGGGFLAGLGFVDFAGSTIVHSTGGWAALAGVLIVGPRIGKFRKNGTVHPTPPSNVPLVTLGVLILWLGWIGFNGGSVLALDTPSNATIIATIMSDVIANTVMAGAAGVLVVMALSKVVLGRMSLLAVFKRRDCWPCFHYGRTRLSRHGLARDSHRCCWWRTLSPHNAVVRHHQD